ncbi:hypothetical protein Pedsa_0965 [Pseudopedobacter saltans DSM 12145]|uniref:Uncharacterized protein n=1 Tax=Pseudopedobacter saltans (strain ATCC 51119 / DSM 12145 / JCM 21818 / CCUG 39354 / LMG 10337 / NBRC 100064 / NCIMB 13643) TaxID=762903 RepID=F0SAU2_PSESL|nr:hypothetical protein [Pseudopedobacter saltans]ADY51537.1 hypothetical protein Pedsa_0965 [Pseudopedobacter saltans DSM 12145]
MSHSPYTFKAAFGHIDKEVTIDLSNGHVIYIIIDGIKMCTVLRHTTGWAFIFKNSEKYTLDDEDALKQRIYDIFDKM